MAKTRIKVFGSGSSPTPCNSLKPTKTGQTTSYATGDDGWFQFGRDTDFFTLSWTNPFGNTNRFTDTSGSQTYANGIGIDWTTYDEDAGEVTGYLFSDDCDSPASKNWTTWFSGAPYQDKNSDFSGFNIVNVNQLHSLLNHGNEYALDYPPFNHQTTTSGSTDVWSSTMDAPLTNFALCLNIRHLIISRNIVTSLPAMLYRQFTLAELGL